MIPKRTSNLCASHRERELGNESDARTRRNESHAVGALRRNGFMTDRRTRVMLAGLAVFALLAASARSDTVVLVDGSTLVGNIGRMDEIKLTITTEFAGLLEIDAAKVVSIATDKVVNVGLVSGDRLVGPMSTREGGAVVQTRMGEIPVAVQDIQAVWPQGEDSPQERAIKQEAEAKVGKWSATLEAGGIYSEGNTEQLVARGKIELRRKSSIDLLKFYASGEYAEQFKRRSAAEAKAGMRYEYLFTDRLYGFVAQEVEYDEFENLELRYSFSLGPGYYWIKEDDHELKTFVGAGYLHETFIDGFTRDDAQLEVGLDYFIDIAEWLKFTHMARYYPTFDSVRDYRLVFDTAFQLPLALDKWSLKFGALYEYDPIPRPGFQSFDQTYYANLALDIK